MIRRRRRRFNVGRVLVLNIPKVAVQRNQGGITYALGDVVSGICQPA